MSIGPADLGFELLPPDPGLVSPDLAIASALAPVVDFQDAPEQPLGKGYHFDWSTNQFVRVGNGPQQALDVDNLSVWVEKVLRTARLAHPIYTDHYGLAEPTDLIGQTLSGDLMSAYEEAIVSALLEHDRILSVDGFGFTQAPLDDAVYVSFTITLDTTATLQTQSLEFTNIPIPGVTT